MIANTLALSLKKQLGERILGPEAPLVGRIRNYYIQQILVKIEKEGISVQKVKAVIKDVVTAFETLPVAKGSLIQVNVDPY